MVQYEKEGVIYSDRQEQRMSVKPSAWSNNRRVARNVTAPDGFRQWQIWALRVAIRAPMIVASSTSLGGPK